MKNKLWSILFHLGMLLVAVITVFPFWWMLCASLMPSGEASDFPPRFFPETFTAEHYINLFSRLNLGRYFLNSLLLALGVTLFSLLVNSMAGFAFAKFRFRGRTPLFAGLISAMIIPGQVTMLPVFLLLNKMGLLNSYFGVILPTMASIFGIFLIRQYLQGVPDSLIEAARIDGAGEWLIYWKIILPLAKPVLVTLALFTFMGSWNDFLWPLIVLTREDLYTLPVALSSLLGEHVQDVELMMAGSVVTVVPVLVVFLALQKYYLQGIMIGGVKE
ncbi:MAG TPA: carbohydrate ABC transporter permease [Calditrichia bacterium]|nr:carbohydrate ABC transporter permease [Calditrichota bacterium]HQU70698.1 carbohydrate ABC transporter permease [Calditrichia bacterium]HQV34245.1 carbohydrate ABC transporter permease [Calditrichia bacterium]